MNESDRKKTFKLDYGNGAVSSRAPQEGDSRDLRAHVSEIVFIGKDRRAVARGKTGDDGGSEHETDMA